MAYNAATGMITGEVDFRDVKQALNSPSMKLSVLCTRPTINMWSRHKPVAYPSKAPIGFSGSASEGNEAKSVNFGVAPGSILTVEKQSAQDCDSDIIDMFDDTSGQYEWTYTPPSGGDSSPFRINDFMHYYHYAVPFIQNEARGGNFNKQLYRRVMFSVTLDPDDSFYNLQAEDFNNAGNVDLSQWHLGLLMVRRRGSGSDSVSGVYWDPSTPLVGGQQGDSGSFLEVNIGNTRVGEEYDAYMFLMRHGDAGNTYQFMKLPTDAGSTYNQMPLRICIYENNSEAGGGVTDPRTSVWICPDYGINNIWRPLDVVCADSEATPKYRFLNNSGNLCLKVKLTNTGSTTGSFTKASFRVSSVEQDISITPEDMYTCATENGTYSGSTNSLTIPAGGTMYVILIFTGDPVTGKSIMKGVSGSQEEVSFLINNVHEFYDTLNYARGNAAWQQIT